MSKKNAKNATTKAKAPKTAKKDEAPATIPISEAKAKKASANKHNKPEKPKKVSALDAAAQVLKAKGAPMTASELIAAMAEKKLWTSPGGKTPAATLYSAMLREITTKGKESRFSRPEKGKFASAAKK